MFLTPHAAAGILIGSRINNPLFAFLLAILSHYLLDVIPHGDENLSKVPDPKKLKQREILISVLDSTGIVLLFLFLTTPNQLAAPGLIWGFTGSVMPDLGWILERKLGWKFLSPINKIQTWFHKIIKSTVSFKVGMLIQLTTLAIFILLNLK